MRIAFCSLVALCLFLPAATAQEWSRFRGPNGSGVVEAKGLPTTLGPEANVRWKTAVGFGRSSPVLTKDVVYLTASDEEGLLVLCLDRATGKTRWERRLARPREVERYHGTDSSAATPATDGENVYAFFQELGLVSFDAQGEQRWIHPVTPFNSFYGQAGSPVLAGDVLIQPCDAQSDSYLLAVGRDDGKLRWRLDRPDVRESWTTPVLFPSAAAPKQVIVFGFRCVRAYAVATGEELWRLGGFGTSPISSPIVYDQLLFVSTPHHTEGGSMPPFSALLESSDKNGDGKLNKEEAAAAELADHFGWVDVGKDGFIDEDDWNLAMADMSDRNYGLAALDLGALEEGEPAQEIWRHKKSLPNIATPLLYEDLLYLVKDGGIVSVLDPVLGESVRRFRIANPADAYYASPVAGDGKVYFTSNAGRITVLEAGAEGKVLAVNDLGEEINATPAIGSDGSLFVRTATSLYCFAGD